LTAIETNIAETTPNIDKLEEPLKSEAKRYLHDISNLQYKIRYMVTRLSDEAELRENTEYATGVNDWIAYQETLTLELMRISGAPGLPPSKKSEPIELQSKLSLVTTMLRILIQEEKGAAVEFRTHFELPQTPTLFNLDWLALERVIMNLVGNAIKFTETGFIRIFIKTTLQPETQQAHLELSIRDTGMGMTGRECSRIFQSGVQANDTIRATYGGTGIGLTYCKDAVTAIGGGSIALKSKKRLGGEDGGNVAQIEDEDTERVTRIDEPDWGTKFSFSISCGYSQALAISVAGGAGTSTPWKETPADTPTSTPMSGITTPRPHPRESTPIADSAVRDAGSETTEEKPGLAKKRDCCEVQ
jgi:signal transduction histidine kinase